MASISKVFACVCTYPYQVIRSRIQVETRSKKKISTLVSHLYKEHGWRIFYKGLGVNILRILPGTCMTFGVYEGLCKLFRNL